MINAIVALLNAVVTNKAKPAIKDASIIPSLQLQIHLANATMNKNDKKDLQEKFDVDLNKCIIDGEHKMPNFTSVANEMHQKFDSIREFDVSDEFEWTLLYQVGIFRQISTQTLTHEELH